MLAALALNAFGAIDSEAAAKKNIRNAIETMAARLGNTPTICRRSNRRRRQCSRCWRRG